MNEEFDFKNGIERLEYLVGTNIESIKNGLICLDEDDREIIELRFGLKDGKEYTLLEVANIMNEKQKNKSVLNAYLDSLNGLKPFFQNWTMETVRKNEVNLIHLLKDLKKLNII